ncbi:MAG: hypothetical protein AMDU1_APLC00029G0001, partial [Thermoplasmatales archaeon A-plasma]
MFSMSWTFREDGKMTEGIRARNMLLRSQAESFLGIS